MSEVSQELGDAVDTSFEMPEQYGSRAYWRYNQVTALTGMVSLPVLGGLSFVDATSPWGRAVGIFGFLVIAAAAIFFIRRDHKVQKRIDETGSPLIAREPY